MFIDDIGYDDIEPVLEGLRDVKITIDAIRFAGKTGKFAVKHRKAIGTGLLTISLMAAPAVSLAQQEHGFDARGTFSQVATATSSDIGVTYTGIVTSLGIATSSATSSVPGHIVVYSGS